MLPIAAALGGLFFGILTGRSIQTAAFFGIVGLLAGFVATRAGSTGRATSPPASSRAWATPAAGW